jgi:integrase/recombinase XerD
LDEKIAESVGLTKKIVTMTYRHTYATVLKRSGVSPVFIKEQLGHTDLKTTENYLDSFELDIKREYSTHLIKFKELKSGL